MILLYSNSHMKEKFIINTPTIVHDSLTVQNSRLVKGSSMSPWSVIFVWTGKPFTHLQKMLNLSKNTSQRMILKLIKLVLWKSLALISRPVVLKLHPIMLKLLRIRRLHQVTIFLEKIAWKLHILKVFGNFGGYHLWLSWFYWFWLSL